MQQGLEEEQPRLCRAVQAAEDGVDGKDAVISAILCVQRDVNPAAYL